MYEKLLRVSLIFVICFNAYSCGGLTVKEVNKINRALHLLELRTSKQKTFSKIGAPAISNVEGIYEGGAVEILYYKTWIKIDPKGKEADSAVTPLYYYNGALVMIGDEIKLKNLDQISSFNSFKNAFPSRKEIYKVIAGE